MFIGVIVENFQKIREQQRIEKEAKRLEDLANGIVKENKIKGRLTIFFLFLSNSDLNTYNSELNSK